MGTGLSSSMLGAWARAFLEKRFESFGVQGLMAGKAAVCSSEIRKDAFEVLLEQNSSMRARAFEGAEGERHLLLSGRRRQCCAWLSPGVFPGSAGTSIFAKF